MQRPSVIEILIVLRHWAVVLRSSIVWPIRANILSSVTVRRLPSVHRRSRRCSLPVFLLAAVLMLPAWPVITRGSRSPVSDIRDSRRACALPGGQSSRPRDCITAVDRGQHRFSNEQGKKGQIKVGQLADLAVLSDDYFSVPENDIVHLRSVLTVLGGRIVHGDGDYASLAPELPAPMPDWSPVATFGGYYQTKEARRKLSLHCGCANNCSVHGHDHAAAPGANVPVSDAGTFWGTLGCGCWAV